MANEIATRDRLVLAVESAAGIVELGAHRAAARRGRAAGGGRRGGRGGRAGATTAAACTACSTAAALAVLGRVRRGLARAIVAASDERSTSEDDREREKLLAEHGFWKVLLETEIPRTPAAEPSDERVPLARSLPAK